MDRRNIIWSIILIISIITCIAAFTLHAKNWISLENRKLSVRAGFYHEQINLNDVSDLRIVKNMPRLHRKNGFSWSLKEKGIYIDSATMKETVLMLDNHERPKIKISYGDSKTLYLNKSDSLETEDLALKLEALINVK